MWFVTKYMVGIRFFVCVCVFMANTISIALLCEAKLQASLVSF